MSKEQLDRLERWIERNPKAKQAGTVENNIAQNVHRLAYVKGYDPGDDNYMAMLEEHLGGSDKSEIRSGGLSPIQKDIARFSGITKKEYADNLKELERQKSIGNYQ